MYERSSPGLPVSIGEHLDEMCPQWANEERHNDNGTTQQAAPPNEMCTQSANKERYNDNGTTQQAAPPIGAIRVPGIDASGNESDDDDTLSYNTPSVTHPSGATLATTTPFASEVAPDVARLEAELQERLRRLDNNVVQVDGATYVRLENNRAATGCCIVL